jgi:hypothetical protein
MAVSKSISDEWFFQNLPKTERTIIREHRHQQNNKDEGKINVISYDNISSHHQRFQYFKFTRYFVPVGDPKELYDQFLANFGKTICHIFI